VVTAAQSGLRTEIDGLPRKAVDIADRNRQRA
jgi:hypothetical protein